MFLLFSLLVRELPTLVLAEQGKPAKYVIVIPSTREIWWNFAATQLQEGIGNITGVKLNITDDKKPLPEYAILLGNNTYLKQVMSPKIEDLSRDAYEIKAVGKYLVINGGSRGTIYGCYDLLEKFGGVRFYASWMNVFPKAKTFEVPYHLDYMEEAKVYYREQYSSDIILNTQHCSHARTNAGDSGMWAMHGGKLGAMFGVHSFSRLMSKKDYPVASFPNQWALFNGVRSGGSPCLSNERTYRIMTDNVMKSMDTANAIPYYIEVSQDDNNIWCQCPTCTEKKKKYGAYSGIIVEFLNRMSDEIGKKYPKALFRTFAYVYSRAPPVGIVPRDNVVIRLCSIEIDWAHPFMESKSQTTINYAKDVNAWGGLAKHLNIYDYVTNFNVPIMIHPNYHVIVPNIRVYIKNHLEGYLPEDSMSWREVNGTWLNKLHADFTEYRQYMISKIIWNPDRNENEIKHDFLKGYYGKRAGPYVKQYMEEACQRVNEHNESMSAFHWSLPAHIDEHFIMHAKWLWDRALEEARKDTDPRYEYNVKMGMLPIYHGLYMWNLARDFPHECTPTLCVPKANAIQKEAGEFIIGNCPQYEPIPLSKGVCFLADKDYREEIMRNNLKTYFYNVVPATITSGGYSASFAEEPPLNGRAVLFSLNGENVLDTMCGIDYLMTSNSLTTLLNGHRFYNTENSSTSAKYLFKDDKGTEEKIYSINDNGLTFTAKSNFVKSTVETTPVISFSLALGDALSVAWNIRDQWYSYALADDLDFYFLGNTTKGATKVTICSPTSKKGVEITFPPEAISFSLKLNRTSKSIRAFIYFPFKIYQSFSATITAKIILSCEGFSIPTKEPSAKSMSRIIFPESMINYEFVRGSRPAPDDDSITGRAIEVYKSDGYFQIMFRPLADYPHYMRQATYEGGIRFSCGKLDKSVPGAFAYGCQSKGSMNGFNIKTANINTTKYIEYPIKNWTIYDKNMIYVYYGAGCPALHLDQIEVKMIRPGEVIPTPLPKYKEEILSPLSEEYYEVLPESSIAGITVLLIVLVLVAIVAGIILYQKRSQTDIVEKEKKAPANETIIV